jgi:hypothetical protein
MPWSCDNSRLTWREENLAAYAAEIPVRLNLMIWDAAIYCTQVEPDTLMVSLRCTLV